MKINEILDVYQNFVKSNGKQISINASPYDPKLYTYKQNNILIKYMKVFDRNNSSTSKTTNYLEIRDENKILFASDQTNNLFSNKDLEQLLYSLLKQAIKE